ncbi:unnamed protein product [Cyclocybe aegerita]|uniref:DUF7053 domain-containing protein n=1 Tax=Cyclocybe aegerita TaxID=1973307 RepID=A0A8S0X438_CYCAE|nr:unnamed protein product [Cyclocybe aegerita]
MNQPSKHPMIQDFWPLFLTRTVILEKCIQGCTQSNALSILHDPEQVFHLSPLVYKIDHDGSWYTLTERLPLFGSYSTTNVYQCQYTKVEEGYDCDVRASLGTRLDVQMRVCGEGKDVVVKEKVVVKALFFLMPYIIFTMTKAHVESSNSLAARLIQS